MKKRILLFLFILMNIVGSAYPMEEGAKSSSLSQPKGLYQEVLDLGLCVEESEPFDLLGLSDELIMKVIGARIESCDSYGKAMSFLGRLSCVCKRLNDFCKDSYLSESLAHVMTENDKQTFPVWIFIPGYCSNVEQMVKVLKKAGVVNNATHDGKTLLHESIKHRCPAVTQTIIEVMGADLDVNQQNAEGETLLMCAATWGDENTVKFLLDAGANISLKNKRNQTVFDILAEVIFPTPKPEIIKLLKEAEEQGKKEKEVKSSNND